jgi:hypothetical protein
MAAAVWPGCGTVPGAQGGDPAITGRDMAARVAFLASDRLEGRGTPGRGLELAASYVESEFRRLRLERAAGAYVQRYPIVVRDADGGSRAESASAPNVVAILRGSDRRLREEFVLVSAHMDGLGSARRWTVIRFTTVQTTTRRAAPRSWRWPRRWPRALRRRAARSSSYS